MKYVGVDLHKQVINLCVVRVVRGKRQVIDRRRFHCCDIEAIRVYFQGLKRFRVVVEATAAYEWFFQLIEDLADKVVLAHPKKLRVIAESTRKTDKIDAEVLAVFLALDMIPQAYRPSPRIRQYRVLVRHRRWLTGRITAAKTKLRNKLAHYNADIANLFSRQGQKYLAELALGVADRFEVEALQEQLVLLERQLNEVEAELQKFGRTAPLSEREAREVLESFPQIGPVTIDVVLSELGDWRRFRSAKPVVAFAGLAPGIRESAGKRRELSITKEGSRLLRWALIQAAWRLARTSPRWHRVFRRLWQNTGSKKKAIVGVARKLLCVMFSTLQSGQTYRLVMPETTKPHKSVPRARTPAAARVAVGAAAGSGQPRRQTKCVFRTKGTSKVKKQGPRLPEETTALPFVPSGCSPAEPD